jgi:hypothetical protein
MNARRTSPRTPSRALVACAIGLLVAGAGGLAACSGDDDEIVDGVDMITTTTLSTATSSGPDELPPGAGGEGVMPNDATGVGPVDDDHSCGALAVDTVADVAPDVVGAEVDGTCYYVDAAGNDVVGVDLNAAGSEAEAGDEMATVADQFDPDFDATRAGCEPATVDGADEALWCTRTDPSDGPSLVVRSGVTTIGLEGFGLGDQSSLTTLAEQALARV